MKKQTTIYDELLDREYGALRIREAIGIHTLLATEVAILLFWSILATGYSISHYLQTHITKAIPTTIDVVVNLDPPAHPWQPPPIVPLVVMDPPPAMAQVSTNIVLPDNLVPDTIVLGVVGGVVGGTGKDTGQIGTYTQAHSEQLTIALPPDPVYPEKGDFVPVEAQPEFLSGAQPVYPAAARNAGVRGSVIVSFLVDTHGSVVKAVIDRANPAGLGFEEATLSAVKSWKFKPAVNNGHPVAVWVSQPVKFALK